MSESPAHAAIEAIARNSYGRLIAYIAARSGDVAGAEDALGDAIAAALERWPADGVPQKPEAWLLHAARNRIIDAARRHQVRQNAETFLRQIAEEAQTVAVTHEQFPDERLKLLFVCAHPAIDPAARTLMQIAPGIGSLVGRAVAVAQAGKPTAGLAALDEIPTSRVTNYQPFWAARGHLLHLLNQKDEARQAFTRAASLTDDPALREYLFKRSADNI